MQPYFESIPVDAACGYCTGRFAVEALPFPVDAVYCISLQEQPHRTAAAVAHFHSIGLCRHVTLYRPVRGVNGSRAIWNSHRALAQHALMRGCRSALMLEDDVYFRAPWVRLAPRIVRALTAVPPDWYGLYLGHVPLQAYFIRANLMRVRSGCTHAYIASARLIKWLADKEPTDTDVVPWRAIGLSIDGALANLPGMYALFPMAARQRFLGDLRIDARIDRTGRRRSWRAPDRWRHHFLFRGAFVAEAVAVAFSPLHRLTLEGARQKSQASLGEPVRLIRAAGLFDDTYYGKMRPDVAAHGPINLLWHYLLYGAAEGAWPHPLFDPAYYAAQVPDLGTENPLLHFIRVGAKRGYKPHPQFDGELYLRQNPDVRAAGVNPLEHFVRYGQAEGRAQPIPEHAAHA